MGGSANAGLGQASWPATRAVGAGDTLGASSNARLGKMEAASVRLVAIGVGCEAKRRRQADVVHTAAVASEEAFYSNAAGFVTVRYPTVQSYLGDRLPHLGDCF